MTAVIDKSNVIGIFSGKGGVGKTTLVSNLGASLSSDFERNVLIIDSNVKTSHLGLHLGLYEELPATLKDVMFDNVPVMQAIFLHPATGLRLLPAPMKGDMDLKKLDNIIRELKGLYEPILVDCAPGLGREVIVAARAIDKALIITTPDLPAVTDAIKTINLLKRLNKDIIGVVINKVRNQKYELTREEIETACECDVIGIIPETGRVPESIAEGLPLVMKSSSNASVELKTIAGFLVGEEYHSGGILQRIRNMACVQKITKNVFMRERSRPRKKNALLKDVQALDTVRTGLKPKPSKKKTKIKSRKKAGDSTYDDEAYIEYMEKAIMKRVKEKLDQRLAK